MSHTNSTPNYSLPQFITTDKPAWLTDINNAFLAIDTGLDAAKDKADDAQADATQALTDAGNAQTAANSAGSKASGAIASISEDFLDSATYAIGDLVIYNNLLYRCHTAVTTPGAWTGSTNWSRTDIDTLINETPRSLNDLSDVILTTPAAGQIISYDGSEWANKVPLSLNVNNLFDSMFNTLRIVAGTVNMPFADGTGSYDISSYLPAGYNFVGLSFACAKSTRTLVVTGAEINSSILTVRTTQTGIVTTQINFIAFAYKS